MKLAELSIALQNPPTNPSTAKKTVILRNPTMNAQVVFGLPFGQNAGNFHMVGKGDYLRLNQYDSTMIGPWGFDITCTSDIDHTFTQVDATGAVVGSPVTVAGGSGGVASFSALNVGDQINVS